MTAQHQCRYALFALLTTLALACTDTRSDHPDVAPPRRESPFNISIAVNTAVEATQQRVSTRLADEPTASVRLTTTGSSGLADRQMRTSTSGSPVASPRPYPLPTQTPRPAE